MKVLIFDKNKYDFYMNGYSDRIEGAGLEMVHVNPKVLAYDHAAEVVIDGRVSRENLSLLPNLKLVIVPYTGLNGLDLPALEEAGVQVMNTSAHGIFVAERALALLLALMGRLVTGHNNLVKGNWSHRFSELGTPWQSIRDKRVAIYGYGTIGKEIGRLLAPWGVELGVLSYKSRDFSPAKSFNELTDLGEWCDVMMISAPLTEVTEGSVGDEVLRCLNGKVLVNVGRGAIVDEKALYERLIDGTLAGYASDVWYRYPSKSEPECQPSIYPIHELENVVMTPHNATFEENAAGIRYLDVLEKVIKFSKG